MTVSSTTVRLKTSVDTLLGWFVTVLMGVAVLNVLWQVFTRFVLQDPSPYTDELARYLLIWVGLVGAAYAMGKRMHLAIDLLPLRLTGRAHHALNLLIDLLVMLFAFFVMVFGGARLVALTLMLEQTSAALQVPLGYVYMALPVSGLLIMFYTAIFMVDNVRAYRGVAPVVPDSDITSAHGIAREVNDPVGDLTPDTDPPAGRDGGVDRED
jgi:TRAP-type C4-dicarboxylate transport system permease small subunit